MNWPLYFGALVLSVVATFWFNPFRHSRRLDAFVVAFVFLLFGLAVRLTMWITPMFMEEPPFAEFLYSVIAIVPGLALAAVTVLQRRRLHWHVESVFHPTFSEARLGSLSAHLSTKRPLARAQDARRAAWLFGTRHQYAPAARLLDEVPLDRVHPRFRFERAIARNDLAGYQIRLGELGAAERALAAVPDVPRGLKGPIGTKRALLAALRGEPDDALRQLGELTMPAGSPHRSTALLAAAHAHAVRGDHDEAKAALRRLADIESRWLERATTPAGPASPIAVALANNDAPYR